MAMKLPQLYQEVDEVIFYNESQSSENISQKCLSKTSN